MSFQKGTLDQAQQFNDNRYLIKSKFDSVQSVLGDVVFAGAITFSQTVTIDGSLVLDDDAFIGIDSDTDLLQLKVGKLVVNGSVCIGDNEYIGIDSDTDLMQLKSNNLIVNGQLDVINTAGINPSDFLRILGDTTDNNNYPGIEFEGGTLVDTYPQIQLDNGGLILVMRPGWHSTNFTKRAIAYVAAGALETSAKFTVTNQDSDTIFDVLASGDIGAGTNTPPDNFNISRTTDTVVSLGIGTTGNGFNGGEIKFYGAGGAELVNVSGRYVDSTDRSTFTVATNNDAGSVVDHMKIDYLGNTEFGDFSGSNLFNISNNGIISFDGLSRISWNKYIANSITLIAGTITAGNVTSLQNRSDGLSLVLRENAGSPGADLYVDFINVTAFNWVELLCSYQGGGSSHYFRFELYKWSTATWEFFGSTSATGVGTWFLNRSFLVENSPDFISSGNVRFRFYHPVAGNVSHNMAIDVVALFQ